MNHIAIWGGERCDPIAHFLPSNINLLLDDDSWSVNEEVDAHPLKPDLQQSHEGQVFDDLVREARDLLVPICRCFAVGTDLPILDEAKALLEASA